MIKDILEDYGVYSFDLELALLRHLVRLRNEMLSIEESEKENEDLISWAEHHYWDSLEKDRDLILLHLKDFLK